MTTHAATGLSVGNVIALIDSVAIFAVVLAVGFSLVGIVAVWRSGREGASEFFGMFERLQVLQLLTVMLVIASATVLALLGLLNSNGITGILSGVAGYVLGGLTSPARAPLPSAKPAAASPSSHAAPIQRDAGL